LKKIDIVKWIGIILFFVYISILIIDIFSGFLGDYNIIVISLILSIISINSVVKGRLIKSSSTMWFAITLILFSILIVIFELKNIKPLDYYFVFSIIPIISSVINLAIFENLIYIKVIIFNISIIIPITIQYFFKLQVFLIAIVSILSIVVGILVCRQISLSKENE
jgi:hypothetical protein